MCRIVEQSEHGGNKKNLSATTIARLFVMFLLSFRSFFPRDHTGPLVSLLAGIRSRALFVWSWIRPVPTMIFYHPAPPQPPPKPQHTPITHTPPQKPYPLLLSLDPQAHVGHLHVVARLGVHADDLENEELLPLRQRLLRDGLHHLFWEFGYLVWVWLCILSSGW